MSSNHEHHNCVDLDQSASVEQCASSGAERVIAEGNRIVRVPVNLGNFTVNTNLVANINFPDPVLEIKDIKKRVEIVQCRLMTPSADDPGTFSDGPFPLFIKGFVRKNIQYATPCHHSYGECVSSEIKSLTAKIPFECMTMVDLVAPALLPVTNTRSEFSYSRSQDLGSGFPEKDKFLSSDLSQFHQSSTQFYNDLPFCELVSSDILEWDEAADRQSLGDGPEDEGYFQHMVEKMSVNITIRVLQAQQVDTGDL